MSEAEEKHQGQNYAEVRFETKAGDTIMEPLKIFKAIDESYQVATPILKGYVLIKKPDELTRTMTTTPAVIRLVYDRIGTLQVYHGLTDVAGELITLRNSDQPDQVARVELPVIPGHHYYVMTDDGLGEQVEDPMHFQPAEPNQKTNLVCLTPAEKNKVDEMETALTIDPDGKLSDLDDLRQPSEDTKPVSSTTEESTKKSLSSIFDKANFGEGEEEAPVRTKSESSATSQHDHLAASKPASPASLLAAALSQICDSLAEADDSKTVAALTDSSKKILDTIRTLTLLDGVKEE